MLLVLAKRRELTPQQREVVATFAQTNLTTKKDRTDVEEALAVYAAD